MERASCWRSSSRSRQRVQNRERTRDHQHTRPARRRKPLEKRGLVRRAGTVLELSKVSAASSLPKSWQVRSFVVPASAWPWPSSRARETIRFRPAPAAAPAPRAVVTRAPRAPPRLPAQHKVVRAARLQGLEEAAAPAKLKRVGAEGARRQEVRAERRAPAAGAGVAAEPAAAAERLLSRSPRLRSITSKLAARTTVSRASCSRLPTFRRRSGA